MARRKRKRRQIPILQGKPPYGPRGTVPFVPTHGGKGPEYGPLPAPGQAGPQGPIPGWEGDIGWQEAQAWAENQRQLADAQYAQELGQLRTSTGLFDAQGNAIDQSQVEQLNPFSQAGMLRRAWREAQTGTLNSYASAGQLYSGALKNAAGVTGADPRSQLYQDQRGGYNSFGYQQNLGGLRDSFNSGVQSLDRWRLGVMGDIDERLLDTSQDARDRFVESRPAPPRAPTPSYQPTSAPKGTLAPDLERVEREPQTAPTSAKPSRAPRPGYRWAFVFGQWREVRKAPPR